MNKNILIVIAIALVLSFVGYLLFSDSFNSPEVNTEDSAQNVSSTESLEDSSITTTDPKSGVVFTHPESLDYRYVSAQDWPPRFTNSDDPIKCELNEQTIAMSGFTTSRTERVNDNLYCIRERSEGAAGSVYIDYEVIYQQNSDYLTMSFTLKYPQCGNYPSEEQSDCQVEQTSFPLYNIIDQIAQSAYLPR